MAGFMQKHIECNIERYSNSHGDMWLICEAHNARLDVDADSIPNYSHVKPSVQAVQTPMEASRTQEGGLRMSTLWILQQVS